MGIVIPFAKMKGYTYNHNFQNLCMVKIDPTVVHVALPLACFIILEVQLNKELHAVIEKGYLWAFS